LKPLNETTTPNPSIEETILDTGATDNFFTDTAPVEDKQPAMLPIHVLASNKSTMKSTHTGLHPIQTLPIAARTGHVLPQLATSLTSIGKACDAGCTAIFTKHKAIIANKVHFTVDPSDIVTEAQRDSRGLWTAPLPNNLPSQSSRVVVPNTLRTTDERPNQTFCLPTNRPSPNPVKTPTTDERSEKPLCLSTYLHKTVLPQANFTVYNDATIRDIIRFHHRCLWSPTKSTFVDALKNNHFVGWPALNTPLVQRHLDLQESTLMGHMDQQRQNVRSTQRLIAQSPEEIAADMEPPHEPVKSHAVFVAIRDLPTGQIYTDQTGPFPTVSSRGVKAVMVLYDYDSNAILVEGITSRSANELLRAFKLLSQRLTNAGLKPQFHTLDNEASGTFKQFLKQQNISFQLTPANLHRRNAAERAIRTFKNHFIAGLSTVDPAFPLYLWCRLLPQAEMTLLLLRKSRINPNLSAYAQLFGQFDYNKTPLGPPGCRVVVFNRPEQRNSWDNHGEINYYVGPAMEHYRCFTTVNPSTSRDRIAETVEFFPHNFTMPALSSLDLAVKAIQQLIACLENPTPSAPFLPLLPQLNEDLLRLATIFQSILPAQVAKFQQQQQTTVAATPLGSILPPRPPINLIPNDDAAHSITRTAAPRVETATAPRVVVPPATASDVVLVPMPSPKLHHCHGVYDEESGKTLEYRQLLRHPKYKRVWSKSSANEFGRLAQGIRNIKGTDTITFVRKSDVPKNKLPTYLRFVCEYRPHKDEKERTRATIGGNLIDYPGDKSSPTADLLTYKIHVNDIISTPDARCVNWDIENFYLETPLPEPEFAKIHLSDIPEEIITAYNLRELADDKDFVYIRVDKGMYGLPQAGILAYELLRERLAMINYFPSKHTPGLWIHATNGTSFVLVVDDFTVKYISQPIVLELLEHLRKFYKVKVDWSASLFCGITTTWNYDHPRSVTLSMPGYVENMLQELDHPLPKKPQHAPYPCLPIQYGAKQQLVQPSDESKPATPTEHKRILKAVGKGLFYSRAVDPIIGPALSSLASEQARPTQRTIAKVNQLLDFCATYPNATIRYKPSDMILDIHSDASYNSEPLARSRSGGYFTLRRQPPHHLEPNGPLHCPTHIIKHVASSAADAEIGATFINCKEALPIRTTLAELGYPQPPTSVTLDNTTAVGFTNGTIKRNRTKAIDMRYYWLLDREAQQQFKFRWQPAHLNRADYPSKHHPPKHHIEQRPFYVENAAIRQPSTSVSALPPTLSLYHRALRGCVDPISHPAPGCYPFAARRAPVGLHEPACATQKLPPQTTS
jgi:hypothetical protein